MDYQAALAWCLDRGVRIEAEGGVLRLTLGDVVVSERVADESWFTHRETFVRLVRRLREMVRDGSRVVSGVFRSFDERAALARFG